MPPVASEATLSAAASQPAGTQPSKRALSVVCNILRPCWAEANTQLQEWCWSDSFAATPPPKHQVDISVWVQQSSQIRLDHVPALQHLINLGFSSSQELEGCLRARIAQLERFAEGVTLCVGLKLCVI